jgi:PAS domain S-box-containing protein
MLWLWSRLARLRFIFIPPLASPVRRGQSRGRFVARKFLGRLTYVNICLLTYCLAASHGEIARRRRIRQALRELGAREMMHEPEESGRTGRPSAEVEKLRRELERVQVLARSGHGVLEAILNHSPHGILVCDAAGKMTLQNRAAERIWAGSATAESVEGWNQYRAFHADGRPYVASDWAMARCLSHGEGIDAHEVDILRFDGTRGVLLASCAPITEEGGRIAGAVSVFADVTRFKEMEGDLRLAHARTELLYRLTTSVAQAETVEEIYEHALDAVVEGLRAERASVLLFDEAGLMRFRAARGLSEAYQRAVDGHSPWTRDEPNPTPILSSDIERDPTLEAFRPALRAEGIRSLGFFPLVHRRRLLGKFMVYAATPRELSEADVQLARAIGTHVAQGVARRQAELEIVELLARTKAAQTAAEQAVRARDELLAIVSHDLRNSINTLSLTATSMMRTSATQPDERLRLQVQRIQRSVSTMDRLIGDLLDVGAIDAGVMQVHPQEHDLASLLEDALDLLRPLAAEHQQALAVESPAGVRVRVDRERIFQVLSNLVGNAVKFAPVDGSIRVRARPRDADGVVEIEVADDGPGIAPEHLPRIFDRFWRPPQQRRGVGLGLAIAKGVIEAHGGTLSVESLPGAGATFRFTLPPA